MSKKKKANTTAGSEVSEAALLEQVVHLLKIQAGLDIRRMKNEQSQPEMISTLDSVGCGPSEIADLLGISTNTVNVSLYRSKKKARKR